MLQNRKRLIQVHSQSIFQAVPEKMQIRQQKMIDQPLDVGRVWRPILLQKIRRSPESDVELTYDLHRWHYRSCSITCRHLFGRTRSIPADRMECSTGLELDVGSVIVASDAFHCEHPATQLQRRSDLSRCILRRDDAAYAARNNPWCATTGDFGVALVCRFADGLGSAVACDKSIVGKSLACPH